MSIKKRLIDLEENSVWQFLIFMSIIGSIFGPPIGVLIGLNVQEMVLLIFITNIIFIFDSAFKIISHGKEYIFSLNFIIDASAIIAGVLELLLQINMYSGPGVANLRILRAMKLLSRSSRGFKGIVRAGKISKITKTNSQELNQVNIVRQIKKGVNVKNYFNKSYELNQDRYVAKIKEKMQAIVMIIMGYIIIRFGSITSYDNVISQAWFDIRFFAEMIFVMIFIGGIIDFYLNKLIGERFRRIEKWVQEKSSSSGFFYDVNIKAQKKSKDEVEFLENYIGIVLDKAGQFPESIRKYLSGVFKPQLRKKIVFLSDIENYSGQTADMDAKEVNHLLNNYVNKIVHILVKYGAEIDKYVGDSIIAFFEPEDADEAFLACLEIISLNNELKTRIGLHVDDIIATYVGPKGYRQMDHFSEGISIAQRIEDHNKKTKTYLLFSGEFYDLLTGDYQKQTKNIGFFKPKGAKHNVKIYTVK